MRRAPAAPIALLITGLLLVASGYAAVLLVGPAGGIATEPGEGEAARVMAPWALALGASLVLTGMLALAAARPGGTPRTLRVTIRLVFVATFGGLAYALAVPAPVADGRLLFGLPRVTALMLLVTGLIPLIVLPVAYARAFERDVLGADDIAKLKAAISARPATPTDA